MPDSTGEIQKAIIAALRADATVAALVGTDSRYSVVSVFDGAPDGVAFPHITIAHISGGAWDASLTDGTEAFFQIDTWSRASPPSKGEAYQIMAAVRDVLHTAALTVAGHNLVNLRLEDQRTIDDPDNRTVHGVQRFRVVTHA